jgi:hypothetical protein
MIMKKSIPIGWEIATLGGVCLNIDSRPTPEEGEESYNEKYS